LLAAPASQPSTEGHARPDEGLLTFLADGQVTRGEIVARLGQPHATFEDDHVIAYRLGHNSAGYYVVSAPRKSSRLDWAGVDYNLMLRFDDLGILQEHNLIGIRHASQPH
jgi:hypothetical protein